MTLLDKIGLGTNGPKATYRDQTLTLAKARNDISDMPNSPARDFLTMALELAHMSRAQIFQDVFVLYVLGRKTNGYFVEFGATDGVSHSNSLMLESRWDWTGLCAEPAQGWHAAFRANRPETLLDTRCVWKADDQKLMFAEASAGALSTIARFKDGDSHRKSRRNARQYEVVTVSLTTLLAEHNAPAELDFLSVDTEGSEFEILSHLDFNRYQPKVITVEHNHKPLRRDLFKLLTSKGYRRVLAEVSQFDDWYVAPDVTPLGRL